MGRILRDKMNAVKKKIHPKKLLKRLFNALILLIIIITMIVGISRLITYFSCNIDTENGVDEGIYVTIGKQEQYLLIRGENTENPVIIWLHGGPASPDAFANYTFQKYLTDGYTVINWDQRGCGRTYFKNADVDPNNETVSFEQAQEDLDELIDYATKRFNKEKVIIVGHSYGTILGSKYTIDHPDKVSAYIGVGQFMDIESEIYSYNDALEKAKAKGDDTSDMENAYKQYCENKSLVNMTALRSHADKYHRAPKEADTLWTGIASPYMGIDDIRWFFKQLGPLENVIGLNQKLFDIIQKCDLRDYGSEYTVPVGFISGSDDWVTPVKYSEDYYDYISAPEKDFAIIDGCGHSPQYDNPSEFCSTLKNMLSEFEK